MEMYTVANLVALGALSLTALGLVFTALQIRYNTNVQRGMLFKEIYERFLTDDKFHYVYGLIEQEELIFARDEEGRPTFGTSDPEEWKQRQVAVEHLFSHLEVICSLHRRGLLTKDDMLDLNYAIERIAQHPGFFEYEAFLATWVKRKKISRGPYDNVFRYVRTKLRITPPSRSPATE